MLILSIEPGGWRMDLALAELGECVVYAGDPGNLSPARDFHAPADRFDGVVCGDPWFLAEAARVAREAQAKWILFEVASPEDYFCAEGYACSQVFLDPVGIRFGGGFFVFGVRCLACEEVIRGERRSGDGDHERNANLSSRMPENVQMIPVQGRRRALAQAIQGWFPSRWL